MSEASFTLVLNKKRPLTITRENNRSKQDVDNPESSFAPFSLLKCLIACFVVSLRAFLLNLRAFEGFAHFSDETPLVAKVGTTCGNNRYCAACARAGAAVC